MSDQVLVVYGVKEVNHEKWLQDKRSLLLLEDDELTWKNFAKSSFGEKILKEKRVKSFFLFTPLQRSAAIKEIALEIALCKFEMFIHPEKGEAGRQFLVELEGLSQELLLTLNYFSDFGLSSSYHLFANLLKDRQAHLLKDLKGALQGIPAIICGGGPSLEKNLPFLKEAKNRACIFAGGAALNVLNFYSIIPHFAGGVDKDAPFSRFKGQNRGETPLFWGSSFASDNLSMWHGPLILAGEPTLQGELFNLFQNGLSIGWNVSNFLVHTASFLGCDPIILVGVDLAFKENCYSQGVYDKNGYNLIEVEGRGGQKCFTQSDWLAARKWLESFAKEQIRQSFFNISDQGLEIPFIPDKHAESLLKDYLPFKYDVGAKIHATLQRQQRVSLDVKEEYKRLEKSFLSILKLLKGFSVDEEKIKNEMAFCYILEPLWKMYCPIFKKQMDAYMDDKIMQAVFFQNVTNQYLTMMKNLWKSTK
jgi:hypothetical protein